MGRNKWLTFRASGSNQICNWQAKQNYMKLKRRKFITLAGLGATSMSLAKGLAWADVFNSKAGELTVGQIIDLIQREIPGAPFNETVDTIKSGSADQRVTGIVTTMFATIDVIRKSAQLKANFIIAHEPTFYNHLDDTEWLLGNDVYKKKVELLQKHGIAVWRFHDYIHAHNPDGVRMGVMEKLGWKKYYDPANPVMVTLPPTTLGDLIDHVKEKLGIKEVRIIGDTKQICSRVALMPGAYGGRAQISVLEREKPDVMLCGEIHEWETGEYVRDARALGASLSLVILGHSVSEEPGLEWLVHWLQPRIPEIRVTHIESGDPFIRG